MHPDDVTFRSALMERGTKEFNERMLALAHGNAADYPDYRERVGYVRALLDVQQWMKDISTQIG
jgi:hypothetical protein